MTKIQNQQTLFGEIDQVFNCLHTELTIVNEEIASSYKRIASIEEKIETLEIRRVEIEKAIKIVKPASEIKKAIEIVKPAPEKKEPSPEFPDDEQEEGPEPEEIAEAEEEEEEGSEDVDITEEVKEETEESFIDETGKNSVIRCLNCNGYVLRDSVHCPGCGHEV